MYFSEAPNRQPEFSISSGQRVFTILFRRSSISESGMLTENGRMVFRTQISDLTGKKILKIPQGVPPERYGAGCNVGYHMSSLAGRS
jgi:hypothetical protein